MFKSMQDLMPSVGRVQEDGEGASVKHVFMVLHGFYGNLFLSKWATGIVNQTGEDQGVLSAQRVWAHGLRQFDAATIELALSRCQSAHPEFPPSLPQFVGLCEAAKPRQVYQPAEPQQSLLEMSPQLRAQRRAKARQAATEAARLLLEARKPSGLDLLKEAIASAAAAAGADEAKVLMRLDRELAAREPGMNRRGLLLESRHV